MSRDVVSVQEAQKWQKAYGILAGIVLPGEVLSVSCVRTHDDVAIRMSAQYTCKAPKLPDATLKAYRELQGLRTASKDSVGRAAVITTVDFAMDGGEGSPVLCETRIPLSIARTIAKAVKDTPIDGVILGVLNALTGQTLEVAEDFVTFACPGIQVHFTLEEGVLGVEGAKFNTTIEAVEPPKPAPVIEAVEPPPSDG
jgi:hypothetical protein